MAWCETGLLANTDTGDVALFRISELIAVKRIVGVVETAFAAAATASKLVADVGTLTQVDLCAALDLTGKTVGTTLNITGTLANAMVAAANGVAISQAGTIVIGSYTEISYISLNNAGAANAGRIRWFLEYEPLTADAAVTPMV